jgi:predicted O-methyltransferase YrrM
MNNETIRGLKPTSIFDVSDENFFIERHTPNDYMPPASTDYYEIYYAIANWYKPKSILEIGVRYGYSLYTMVMGSDLVETAVGYDIPDSMSGEYKYVLHDHGKNSRFDIVRDNFKLYCPKSINLDLQYVNTQEIDSLEGSYDMIHVDGNHSFEGKMHDLELSLGRCKTLIVDDCAVFSRIRDAVIEFTTKQSSSIKNLYFVDSRNMRENHAVIEFL